MKGEDSFSKGSAALAARDLILLLELLSLNLSSDLWTFVPKYPALFTKERKLRSDFETAGFFRKDLKDFLKTKTLLGICISRWPLC
ncbi:MAG: hypothetical protein LBG46_07500 [Elusimicrobiota bacterium]|nr:hypothetical protein [Elusimicrobiota bacterium]